MTIGSSPQARGTLGNIIAPVSDARFIPAGAGNTDCLAWPAGLPPVHPRRRGEHPEWGIVRIWVKGSSPQARGTLAAPGYVIPVRRFIPAGAGNTRRVTSGRVTCSVHPRRRGEHVYESILQTCHDGSSPQARGTRAGRAVEEPDVRFIPAGAGNTPGGLQPHWRQPVHPRRRGEHFSSAVESEYMAGSSPQARGTHHDIDRTHCSARFIPAGAGNTRPTYTRLVLAAVHPRRRGEHICTTSGITPAAGSSPQARGTPDTGADLPLRTRFIPAGAGNTRCTPSRCSAATVHPRRRGEHFSRERWAPGTPGSSPQARGTLGALLEGRCIERFIPAGAGNTTVLRLSNEHKGVHPRRRGEHFVRRDQIT